MELDAMILVYWMLSFKPAFSLSSFTLIKSLFSSFLLSAIGVVSSVYLRLLIFLLAVLIPACDSSSLAFYRMYSAFKFSSVQLLSCVRLFATPWIAACQASLSITISRSSLKLTSFESVMPSSHLIPCRPLFSCPQSLPASESFPMSQLFSWGGQSIGVSALASFKLNHINSMPFFPTSSIATEF